MTPCRPERRSNLGLLFVFFFWEISCCGGGFSPPPLLTSPPVVYLICLVYGWGGFGRHLRGREGIEAQIRLSRVVVFGCAWFGFFRRHGTI